MTAPPWHPDFARGPWFAPVAAPAAALASFRDWPAVDALDRALAPWLEVAEVRLALAAPLQPVTSEVYELRIADDGVVPTRPGSWHDLLNALQWAAFPRAKRALTLRLAELQRPRVAARSAVGRMPGRRDPEHDRLALVDEGGLIVLANAAVTDEPAMTAAVAAGQATALVFGHALQEHALSGDRTVRAAPVVLLVPSLDGLAAADAALAAAFTQGAAAWRPCSPGWAIDDRWLVR